MTNDDWGYFPELTVGQNEEIKAARDAGYMQIFPKALFSDDPALKTLAGARAYLKEHSEIQPPASPYPAGEFVLERNLWCKLPHENLVKDTIVVTGDPELNEVYIEGEDYHVDYKWGAIRRNDESPIRSGGTVYVWYFYYETVQVKVDAEPKKPDSTPALKEKDGAE